MKKTGLSSMKTWAGLLFSLFVALQGYTAYAAGTCGPAAGSEKYILDPDGRLAPEQLCTSGTYANVYDDPLTHTYWDWTCGTAGCQAYIAKCGSANNTTSTNAPTVSSMCDPDGINTPLILADNTWTWNCVDSEAREVSCQRFREVDGSCGSATTHDYIGAPTSDLCSVGTASAVTVDGSTWKWTCAGVNGGDARTCRADIVSCGYRDGGTYDTLSSSSNGLCDPTSSLAANLHNDTSNPSDPRWVWDCVDYTTASVSCWAHDQISGSCGSAKNIDYVNPPASNLCAAGTASAVTNNGSDQWIWTCSGVNTGTAASCASDIVNCGSTHGTNQTSQPTSNLCSEGTASVAVDSGDTWTWTCTDGIGEIASCFAYDKDNGACGSANNGYYENAPDAALLCTSGTASAVVDDGTKWKWDCVGTFGGSTSHCSAWDVDNGSCGAAQATATEEPPTADLCSLGTASTVTAGETTWNWTCSGSNGGTTVNCSNLRMMNGDCGPANGGTFELPPTSGLCDAGVATAVVTNDNTWSWECTGVAGGTTAACVANRIIVNDYCAAPPFIVSPVEPNVMAVIDASGSMGWKAYNYASTGVPNPVYNANEEGYFRPDKNYKYNSTAGYWEETITGTVEACPGNSTTPSTSKIYVGTCLNYHFMTRMDLVRWAMTGGRPASCSTNPFSSDECDPELWEEPGNTHKVGEVCNNTIGGCIIESTSGRKVKVPWNRIWDGLVFQFKAMSLKPRMGALFYSGSTVRTEGQVYMGDFTAPNSTSGEFPYLNLITAINSTAPDGGTPTGPAMWDAFNYFKQSAPQFGGIPVQQGDGDRWKNPMYVCDGGGANCKEISCAKNFVLLMSDGQWNSPSCSIDNWKSDPVKPAYEMHQPFTNLKTNKTTNVNATHTIGIFLGGTGEQSLKNVAMYGSFNKTSGWPDSLTGYPDNTCDMDDCGSDGKGSACEPLPASSADWDSASPMNIPDTFHSATNASEIKSSIKNALLDMLRRTSSGTAVSVLSSSEGSGSNLMQALFYPKRAFSGGEEIAWTSDLMNYWYYMDPYFTSATIREDTVREGASYTLLDLKQDYISHIAYDASEEKTNAYRYQDVNGNGSSLIDKGKVPVESTAAIWRAGFNLWWTDPADRKIYTSVTPPTLIPFDTTKTAVLDDYLGKTSSEAAANSTINYVRGYDCVDASGVPGECGATYPTLIGRSRTVSSGVCIARRSPCTSDAECGTGDTCSSTQETHAWKLGDIISSTPRIMGPSNLNTFNLGSPFGYGDKTYKNYIKSDDYANRQLVFVGANDGMMHAFKLGKLLQKWSGKNWWEAARQEGIAGAGGIGSEAYAYIPKNVLPYVKYLQDTDYCHVYMVDGPTVLSDVAINKPATCNQADYWNCPKRAVLQANTNTLDTANTSWRPTLVGSIGIGGATCAADDADRIKIPLSVGSETVGWSSYFALDVSDQTTPELLWEFSHPDLGVTNVGSTTVKVGGNDKRCEISNDVCTSDSDCADVALNGQCVTTNGRWFTILASGSTGPIVDKQFKGTSDQNLKIFILDHKTGDLLRAIDTGISNAYAGALSSSAIDLDKDKPTDVGNYQDDAVYVGYVKDTTNGGVLRLVINDDINPDNWTVSKVIDNIGPVTTSVVNLLDRKNKKFWLYFGEGRYFYKLDDLDSQRRLFGIEEPCFDGDTNTILPACTDSLSLASLKDQTLSPTGTLLDTEKGWYISMGASSGDLSAERVISNPTPDSLGAVYFLSFSPSSDVCSFGGTSYLWAVDYNSGGAVTDFEMKGKALVQVSTGEIKELSLGDAFTENDDRKSVGFKGIPPTGQGLMVVKPPEPIKRFIHVQEQ